jgi:hypothetical protein
LRLPTTAKYSPACLPRSLYTLRVELYSSPADQARLAFEVLLTLAVFVQLLVQLGQMIVTWWADREACLAGAACQLLSEINDAAKALRC